MLRLGAFLSIAKGIDKVVPQAQEIGANTFQFFTRNPRGGAARTIGAVSYTHLNYQVANGLNSNASWPF